ncbi:hypothetical protein [Lentzea albidocapillata]|uniref:Uncharacterized protein n=1 Tax=Lentzea albidocapillata TaxID=40571 RepID=A0A1W2F5C1_9PSEU|nr:hypothetical protein [Lentzea albidocapillata]SMD17123.1 hypothetical protein SAMN05660733_05041 [Lentzea albidocapillata]
MALAVTAYVAGQPDGNSATDEKARQVAERIGYPRGTDGNAYARSALWGNTDQKYFAVLEITDSPTTDPEKVHASLLFRVHHPGTSESPPSFRLWDEDPVTACYRADFNHYGVTEGGPGRVRCPADARPVVPPPTQLTGVPEDYLEAFKTILTALPPNPTADEVLAALRANLPPVPVDPETKLPWAEPRLDAFVKDGAVGIVAGGGGSCLNGVRLANGTVEAWYPPRVQTQPGEIGCSGQSALVLYSTPPPK